LALPALLCAACGGATAPSAELVAARSAYNEARASEASQLNPKGVHEAYRALTAAEAVHQDDAGSKREQHYAYIATRKSELAVAQASEELARREQVRAEATYKASLEQTSKQVAQQSSDYAQQLSLTQQQLQQNSEQLEQVRAKAARAEAELLEQEALREDAGRLVISLSGVLFESGGDRLSKPAELRLDTVVQALGAYPDRPITIEGYTDSQGSDATNRELSQRRADAVREYLEQHGVEPRRVRAVGKGEANPVASNETAEGRATNRRVEIIVERQGEGHDARDAEPAQRSSSAAEPRVPGAGREPRESDAPAAGEREQPSAARAPRTE
jgi:outer membrane protein OmpA-like peptidoglycan-associated protein